MKFPDGFMWGASTAGHQVEGGNVNADIWPLEWATETRCSRSRPAMPATTTTGTRRTSRLWLPSG